MLIKLSEHNQLGASNTATINIVECDSTTLFFVLKDKLLYSWTATGEPMTDELGEGNSSDDHNLDPGTGQPEDGQDPRD